MGSATYSFQVAPAPLTVRANGLEQPLGEEPLAAIARAQLVGQLVVV